MKVSKGFGSDNHSGVIPEILAGIQACASGHEPSYGTDSLSEKWDNVLKREFGDGAQSFFVFNGTAANTLCFHAMVESHQSILVADTSHANVDECGAPEKFVGCKLIPIRAVGGKMRVADLEEHMVRRGDQHFSQVRALSITQPTEYGTVYTISELTELQRFAKAHNLYLHMDGARLFNAAESLGCSLRECTEGFDAISLGGTKNGLIFGEAVVFLNDDLADEFKFKRKQAMQLPSKTRFIAAQFLALFENVLWLKTAAHVNQMAKRLEGALQNVPGVLVTQQVEANAVFARLPKAWIGPLRSESFFYVWDERTFEVRLMMSFDTTSEEIDGFVAKIKQLAGLQK